MRLNVVISRPMAVFIIFALSAGVVLVYGLTTRNVLARSAESSAANTISWHHYSTDNGWLELPTNAQDQVVSMVLDIDRDGVNDFIIGSRRTPNYPTLVWYRRHDNGWTRYLIDSAGLNMNVGGTFFDIDEDGDLDVVNGADGQNPRIWWWENPYPNYNPTTTWTRREIKDSGAYKHHDMIFGDFDGDGATEFVYWNQGAKKLFMVNIPANPTVQPWPGHVAIFTAPNGNVEGLAKADVDLDGKIDIIGGGYWFNHNSGTSFTANVVELNPFIRVAAGQLIPGGRPEIVQVPGDTDGVGRWFEWVNGAWLGRDLPAGQIRQGHSLDLGDANDDGHLDIFLGEMRFSDGHAKSNPNARTLLLLGNSQGNFTVETVATGFGQHESRLSDLDGDGDLDILGKPFSWDTPRLDIWLNRLVDNPGPAPPATTTSAPCAPLASWTTRVIDHARPHRAVFIDSADVDGDGLEDIVTGAWWYRNPGSLSGSWARFEIGAPLNQMAVVHDFDGDGFPDILGTKLKLGAVQKHLGSELVWARNGGSANPGVFEIYELGVIPPNGADFLQGAIVASFQPGKTEVVLSWHSKNLARLDALAVPADPIQPWTSQTLSNVTQSEEINAGDIDGDNDLDLLLGTKWLQNAGNGSDWNAHTLFDPTGSPDRNHLADMNGDGRLDAVIGYETNSSPGKLAWYMAPANATQLWNERIIDTIVAPMSLDVADLDGDGDMDVVAGEHNKSKPNLGRVYVYLNNGDGMNFQKILVASGNEHHAGTQLGDMDGDGDFDILSIGWVDDGSVPNQVHLYEQENCGPGRTPTPSRTPTRTPTPGNTPTHTPTPTITSTPAETTTPTTTATPTATSTAEPNIGDRYFYLSSRSGGTVGAVEFASEDILEFDEATGDWRLYFDGSDVGLGGNDVDGFAIRADGTLLLSLEDPQTISGPGSIDDSDILRFTPDSLGVNTVGTFTLYFDGSDVGLSTDSEDINAFTETGNRHLIISTLGKATVPGLVATRLDLMRFTPTGNLGPDTMGSWSLYLKGSAIGLTTKTEPIFAVTVVDTNHIYLATLAAFSLGNIKGGKADIFECVLAATGANATCDPAPAIVWRGSQNGFGAEGIDALFVSQGP